MSGASEEKKNGGKRRSGKLKWGIKARLDSKACTISQTEKCNDSDRLVFLYNYRKTESRLSENYIKIKFKSNDFLREHGVFQNRNGCRGWSFRSLRATH